MRRAEIACGTLAKPLKARPVPPVGECAIGSVSVRPNRTAMRKYLMD